jgi:hypothetical protein
VISPQQAKTILTAERLLLASGWLAPGLVVKLFGLDPARNEGVPYTGRLFAIRDGLMGVQLLELEGDALDRALQLGMAVDLADLAAAGIAGARGQLPRRAAILSALLAGLAAWLGHRARSA